MSGVTVERKVQSDTRIIFTCENVCGIYRAAEALLRQPEYRMVNWASIGSVTPAEAREFSAAIIAVADAVEREGKE